MRSDTELERLAAVRPAILDRTEEVVSPAAQTRILREILAVPGDQRSSRRAARERPRPLGLRGRQASRWTGVAAASVAGALLAGAVLAWNNGHRSAAADGSTGGPAVTLTASTVLTRSIGALDRVGDAVEYSHSIGSLNGRAYTSDLWVYHATERQRLTGPGSADTAGWQAVANGTLTKGFVYYDSRTWALYSSTADPTWARVARTPTAELEANLLRYALDSGRWTVTGHAVVDGQQAIVIQVSESMPARPVRAPAGTRALQPPAAVPAGPMIDVAPFLTPGQYARARAHGQTTFTPTGTSTTTLYISAKTYLPIRQTVTTHLTSQGMPESAADQTESSAFQWLAVTQANLALLEPPAVPAGFTKVNPAGQ